MELLFELFSNPIALFILIGVISSLFNKAKGNAQQQQRRPVRPARPSGGLSEAEAIPVDSNRRPQPIPRQKTVPIEPQAKQTEVLTGNLSDIQKRYQERKEQTVKSGPSERTAERSRMTSGESAGRMRQPRESQEPELAFKPEKDRLVEGLIWAEVLSKPRAKKPHHPFKRD